MKSSKGSSLTHTQLMERFWALLFVIYIAICLAMLAPLIYKYQNYCKLSKAVPAPENVWKFKDGWWLVDEINTYHVHTNSSEYILIPGTRVRPLTVPEIKDVDLRDHYLERSTAFLLAMIGLLLIQVIVAPPLFENLHFGFPSLTSTLADCYVRACRKDKGVD